MIAKWMCGGIIFFLLLRSAAADALERSVPVLNFSKVALSPAVKEISRATGAAIVVAWDSLDPDLERLQVDAHFNGCKLGAALRRLFPSNAQIYATDSTIQIG